MRGGSADSPSTMTVPASTSLNIMTGDDSMSDDVFEVDDEKMDPGTSSVTYVPPPHPGQYASMISERLADNVMGTPSPTGYRDYTPPAEVLQNYNQSNFGRTNFNDRIWTAYKRDQDNPENFVHKTILLGDSGVGKTSLLVQFDTGRFQHGNFAATVGIGFTEQDPLQLCREGGNGRVLLCDVWNVWIDKAKLTHFQRWRRQPKEMLRRLLKTLVGEKNLKNMCARGRSRKRDKIPEDIISAVEFYVNEKCHEQLKPVDITNVTNMMICSLRNPRR